MLIVQVLDSAEFKLKYLFSSVKFELKIKKNKNENHNSCAKKIYVIKASKIANRRCYVAKLAKVSLLIQL